MIGQDSTLNEVNGNDVFGKSKESLASKDIGFVTGAEFDTKYVIPTGKINYTNLSKDARVYDAVVSLSGESGTFKDIQLAINYVNSLGGGYLLIQRGTYILNSDITLYSNIKLVGEDTTLTILDFNSQAYSFKAIGTSGAHLYNIGFENLTIQKSISITYGAIGFDYVDFITIKNCQFLNNYSAGDGSGLTIYLGNSTKGIIENNYSSASDLVVFCYLASAIRITSNDFSAPQTIGIKLHRSNAIYVRNNRITNAGTDAIWCASCRTCDINENVTIDPGASGIHLTLNIGVTAYTAVSQNIMQNSAGGTASGLLLDSGQGAITVTGNVAYGTAGTGFNIVDADFSTFTGNVAYEKAVGFNFGTASDRNTIVSNVAIQCGTALVNNSTNGTAGFNVVS